MYFIEQLNQNPFIALVVLLVPVLSITWQCFHSLYVKPRDFKIDSLKDDVSKLEKELVRLRSQQENQAARQESYLEQNESSVAPPMTPISSALDDVCPFEPSVRNPSSSPVLGSPLSSLAACYTQWDDDTLTALQKQRFEDDLIGKQVSWLVQVDSVGDSKFDMIYLCVREPGEGFMPPRAHAQFCDSDKEMLAALNIGDRVILRGVISKFFLLPTLDKCQVEKLNGMGETQANPKTEKREARANR